MHTRTCDDATAAILSAQRDAIERCREAVARLPCIGIATVPYSKALRAAHDAIEALLDEEAR
jgi:hypothetical protein